MSKVLFEQQGHIGIITLNNPVVLNALSESFMNDINEALDKAEIAKDLYVLIITGTEKAFIAGADIKEMLPLTAVESLRWAKVGLDLNTRIETLNIPVIAAVNGFALGGGCELAMACDIRIASEKAKFGQPECGLGITPGAGGTQRLPRLVGPAKAKELLYTGKIIGAEEACRIGLANEVVAPDALMDTAMEMATMIAKNAQIAVQQIKKAVNIGIETDLATGLAYELQAFSLCHATEDKTIGMTAFVNKEKEKNFICK
jgi:enoyl-CoA hydratase